jgi:nitric oxide reductase activation protein
MVEAMRAALVFRQERPQHDVKLQRSGEMDDEELWRWSTGDDRLFTERVVEARPDTALGMLVDISGSMRGGGKIQRAQRLAQILLAAASDTEGVTPWVWAHTGDSETGEGADVFTVWEPGDPASRLGLIGSLDNGNNYDSYALGVVADRMRSMEQEQKVLLVLSDGQPAGTDYGGAEAHDHMRQVCRWAEAQGVTVISIAIDGALNAAAQAAMFGDGNWVPYTSDRQLPRDLTAILGRYAR